MATTRKKKSRKEDEEQEDVTLGDLLGMAPVVVPVEEVVQPPKKLSPFDFINSITFSKVNLIVDETTERQYVPFIVNRGLSYSMDTVFYANEMNCKPQIDKLQQFQFLLHTVVKRKRYDKWSKKEVVDNLDLVKEFYGFSDEKAMIALSILTSDQIEKIRQKMDKGGVR